MSHVIDFVAHFYSEVRASSLLLVDWQVRICVKDLRFIPLMSGFCADLRNTFIRFIDVHVSPW